MSEHQLIANDLISMGVNLSQSSRPEHYSFYAYKLYVETFVDRLRDAGFSHALNAVAPLCQSINDIAADANGQFEERFERAKDAYRTMMSTVNSVLLGEGQLKTLILTDAEVSPALAKLANLSDRQQLYLRDLKTCLQAHLARPAIVMAWTLGYDMVRSWLFDAQRLADFNRQLGNPQVVNYEDFYRIGERRVLDTCLGAQSTFSGFTQKTHAALVHLLDDRNRFAHANDSDATIGRANVYVEKVVELLSESPFQ